VQAVGGKNRLTLRFRHLAQIAKRASYKTAAIRGKRVELLGCTANLLALLRTEVLQRLVALQQTATLLLRHAVQPGKIIELALLRLRRKLPETRLILESPLLLREAQAAVAIHPLLKVLLIRLRTSRRPGPSRLPLWRGSSLPWRRVGLTPRETGRGAKER
jgi:hypothetical protein